MLFIPANKTRYIDKGLDSDVDALILDLEDSVSQELKEEARLQIIDYSKKDLLEGKTVFIRINEINSINFIEDISKVILPGIDGIMPSKINDEKDIEYLDRLLLFFERKNGLPDNKISLAPLIETASAVARVNEIARASKRLVAICFGGEDYLNDIGSIVTYNEEAFIMPRSAIVNAARKEKIKPIDTPFIDYKNQDAFFKKSQESYKNGFAGRLLLHPIQIDACNKAYMPDEEQIEMAERVMAAEEEAVKNNKNIILVDGRMIGPPMLKKCKNAIRQYTE